MMAASNMPSAERLYASLVKCGVQLRVIDGKLNAKAAEAVLGIYKDDIRAHRDELLALVVAAAEMAPAETRPASKPEGAGNTRRVSGASAKLSQDDLEHRQRIVAELGLSRLDMVQARKKAQHRFPRASARELELHALVLATATKKAMPPAMAVKAVEKAIAITTNK